MITSQLSKQPAAPADTRCPFTSTHGELVSGPLQVQRQGCQDNVIKVDAGGEELNRGRGMTFFDF